MLPWGGMRGRIVRLYGVDTLISNETGQKHAAIITTLTRWFPSSVELRRCHVPPVFAMQIISQILISCTLRMPFSLHYGLM